MKSKLKKYSLFLLIISLSFSFPLFSYADFLGSVSIDGPVNSNVLSPSPGDAATQGMGGIFESLGINKDTLNSYVGVFNTSLKKQPNPQVSLDFSPSNPDLGQKITATATPTYFLNDTKNLYFTWFLKEKDCDKTDSPNSDEKKKCDLNNDGKVNIKDYKIKAMRIIANNDFDWKNATYSSPSDNNSSYEAYFGGNDQRGRPSHCFVKDISSGDTYSISCSHLFPNAPRETTGDGSFGYNEEKFWHTDPTSTDTAQTGNVDEANVAGLGINQFSWNYSSGDEVGVVVEGIAATNMAQTEDSSYRTMWAATKGLCNKTTLGEGIDTSVLNECLYDSLVSPSENSSGSNKLNVTFSASPKSPINDPGSYSDPKLSNGDELVLQSSIDNADDDNYLQYSWQVFESDEINPESWGEPLLKADLPDASQMEGLGLTSFRFRLNMPSPKKYLNVRLTVKENVGGELPREGHHDELITLASSSDSIGVYATNVSSDSSTPKLSMASEICTDAIGNAVCSVPKDSIIGLKTSSKDMTDFLWKIDGQPFTYSSCFFDGCDPAKQSDVAYFPVLKEVGSQYTINLTAINSDTGEKINLSRTFKVIDPKISIISADKAVCKANQLGNYIDTDGKSWPDYSTQNFTGVSNSPIRLKAVVEGFEATAADYVWFVNGTAVTNTSPSAGYSVDGNGVLTIPASQAGTSYTVLAKSLYAQNNPTKTALATYWNVPYDQLYEKTLSSSINLDIQDGTPTTVSAKTGKIMATIYNSTPAYLAFLLRIALTIFLILFASRLILMFFPEITRK